MRFKNDPLLYIVGLTCDLAVKSSTATGDNADNAYHARY